MIAATTTLGNQSGRATGSPWTFASARAFLCLSDRTFRQLVADGKILTIVIGKRRFVPDAEVSRVSRFGTDAVSQGGGPEAQ